jgi:hypothetical protein
MIVVDVCGVSWYEPPLKVHDGGSGMSSDPPPVITGEPAGVRPFVVIVTEGETRARTEPS